MLAELNVHTQNECGLFHLIQKGIQGGPKATGVSRGKHGSSLENIGVGKNFVNSISIEGQHEKKRLAEQTA